VCISSSSSSKRFISTCFANATQHHFRSSGRVLPVHDHQCDSRQSSGSCWLCSVAIDEKPAQRVERFEKKKNGKWKIRGKSLDFRMIENTTFGL